MKKPDLSRAAAPLLSAALSLTLSLITADALAAYGMKAVAQMKGTQPTAESWLVRSDQSVSDLHFA